MHPTHLEEKGKRLPEDCGGLWGYLEMRDTLSDNKNDPEYEEYTEWLDLKDRKNGCRKNFFWKKNTKIIDLNFYKKFIWALFS